MITDDADAQRVKCDFSHLLSSSSDEISVKGGSNGVKSPLKSSLNFWVETLDASDFVLDIIRRGYRLPFAEYPLQCFLKNNRSALPHPDFVAVAIIELLSNSCIVEHDVPPFCVNPLTVAEGKKLRLVIDLRHVNNYLVKPKLKCEDALAIPSSRCRKLFFSRGILSPATIMLICVLINKSI